MNVHHFIATHGAWSYPITFVWTFFEGETFVLFAAFAAAEGLLNAPLILVAAWFGSFAGDQCYFWIGRRFGLRVLARQPKWRGRVDSALAWLKRFDIWFILSFRFIYGVRNFSSFALGISGIDWRRFLILNFTAAGLWATIFVGVGYLTGHALEKMLGEVARDFGLVMLVVFALILIGAHVAHRLHRRRRRAAVAHRS
ncbi:MAG: DedA family protein [Alphaproteobacteria bacterium]|jgi:membrane protein DedA with SNARE-associated domain|nr:DedA family protein [Alphaproteobacteria bacterium]